MKNVSIISWKRTAKVACIFFVLKRKWYCRIFWKSLQHICWSHSTQWIAWSANLSFALQRIHFIVDLTNYNIYTQYILDTQILTIINNSLFNWRRAYQYFPIILWSFRYFGGLCSNSGLSGKSRDRRNPVIETVAILLWKALHCLLIRQLC